LVPLPTIVVLDSSEHAQNIGATGIYSQFHHLVQRVVHQLYKNAILLEGLFFGEGTSVSDAMTLIARALCLQGLCGHFNFASSKGTTSVLVDVIRIQGTNMASDKAYLFLKDEDSAKTFLDGRTPLSLSVLSNAIRALPSASLHKMGRPLISK
jgi:hypothetical protein